MKEKIKGLLLCMVIAVPAWLLGRKFAVVGGPVISSLLGMVVGIFLKNRAPFEAGIKFTSKKILQWAVILLGFGMNLTVIGKTGVQSLPIILSTITTSLLVAFIMCRALKIPSKISTLVGVGSSICGGSAIAATAPVIDASDEEVAQAISVIFFYNVIAALIFPLMGTLIGFSTTSGEAFGIFAGTAVNDTSSVTAAAAVWDGMHEGANALDYATIVKLTRTLAIIPITFVLALWVAAREKKTAGENGQPTQNGFSLKRALPTFIVLFLCASIVATVASATGIDMAVFQPLKLASKFFIVMAMAAIGLNTDVVGLVKSGAKPIVLGAACWIAIASVSLGAQHMLGLW